jgi:hypothetical protein
VSVQGNAGVNTTAPPAKPAAVETNPILTQNPAYQTATPPKAGTTATDTPGQPQTPGANSAATTTTPPATDPKAKPKKKFKIIIR